MSRRQLADGFAVSNWFLNIFTTCPFVHRSMIDLRAILLPANDILSIQCHPMARLTTPQSTPSPTLNRQKLTISSIDHKKKTPHKSRTSPPPSTLIETPTPQVRAASTHPPRAQDLSLLICLHAIALNCSPRRVTGGCALRLCLRCVWCSCVRTEAWVARVVCLMFLRVCTLRCVRLDCGRPIRR